MIDVMSLACLGTVVTILVIGVLVLIAFALTYVADHWDDAGDYVKALGAVLLIWVFWVGIIAAVRQAQAQQQTQAEVDCE